MVNNLRQIHSPKFQHLGNLYQQIYRLVPISKKRLLKRTKLKQTTLTRYLKDLINHNLINEYYDESTGGRPPALYNINFTYNYIIGINISRTHSKITLVDLKLKVVDHDTFTMTNNHTPKLTIEIIVKKIYEMLRRQSISLNRILGIGIGAVGPLDRNNGIILNPDSFLAPNWENVPIVNLLQKEFPEQLIQLENGANTAALGEYYHTSQRYHNLLYCISGVGLRCGVLANGQIVQNNTGDASSFGHIIIQSEYKTNSHVTLTSRISLNYIFDQLHQIDHIENTSHLDLINLLKEKLNNGDTIIKEILMESAYYFGIGLANMINILHPDRVILNSILIHQIPCYYEQVVETAKNYIFPSCNKNINFSKGVLKNNAVSVGAATLILDSLFHSIK